MSHRGIAMVTIGLAVVLDVIFGLLFAQAERIPAAHGLFCGLANAVTDGCDIPPRTTTGYVVTALEYFLVVPLFAATFSLFTSGLTGLRIDACEAAIREHVTRRLQKHHTELIEHLDGSGDGHPGP